MKQQKGFSLVELMIAITVGIVLMTGVVQMFLSSKTVFTTQQGMSRLQETGRLAVDYISRDIRQAGYFGCANITSWNLKNNLANQAQYGSNFSLDNLVRVYTAETLPVGLDLDPAPVAQSQVLIVQSANERSVAVTKENTADSVFVDLTTAEDADCPSDICAGDVVAVADCDKAIIFQATGVAGSEASGEVTITHEAGADPGNSRLTWGGGEARVDIVDTGAELFGLSNVVYYVAQPDADEPPGLYQKVQFNPAYELLQGVEAINYFVGEDVNADRSVDAFEEVAADTNWSNIAALRMDILVQTPDDNVSSDKQTYEFSGAGAEAVTADDNRIRQVFSTTVGIRPRLN
ncbi:PilW family protein [Gilvimarinus sp. SDUM040013]|uniref:PilW family protein n=2 Tax=Gilvimarinus gilvus TaxID=3058038 RepID=A0ABU4S0P3_9GAMM|nr:PilW family protein [Gilvimarinus sp. SDUM040013]MDO3384882.1 PilW family protein [Gilvimarinus sp. SDUM040013]MDX6850693.1 PilW family protein [Gilvimarinus sp. SDUM040013]